MANLLGSLLEHPDLVTARDAAFGYTALHWAAKHGNVQIARFFMTAGAHRNAQVLISLKNNRAHRISHHAVEWWLHAAAFGRLS